MKKASINNVLGLDLGVWSNNELVPTSVAARILAHLTGDDLDWVKRLGNARFYRADPPFLKEGGTVFYRVGDLIAYARGGC